MFNTEFDHFVRKFFQLRQAGHTAHLDVDTQAGQVRVALSVELGAGHAPEQLLPRRSRSPSYYRRQTRRKADREAAGKTSNADVNVPETPAAEAEARGEDDPGASAAEAAVQTEDVQGTPAGEAEVQDEETQTIMANSRTTSEFSNKEYGELYASIGWKEEYRVGNFEGIIIEAIASIEEIDDSEGKDFYHRNLKCKHCRTWWQEQYFYEHQCYDRKSWFCDEMRARIRAGAADTAAICSL